MFDNLFSNKDLIHKAEWLDILAMHAGIGVWDAIFYEGDFMHPKARWTFSSEFRRLCGFTTASEFPDVMQSWSERLHPDDAEAIFATFSSACASGVSYDVKYRLKVKNGTYRWFRATGASYSMSSANREGLAAHWLTSMTQRNLPSKETRFLQRWPTISRVRSARLSVLYLPPQANWKSLQEH